MKSFIATALLLVASASANVQQINPKQTDQAAVPQYAEARDATFASSDFQTNQFAAQPVQYSTGSSYYNSDPGFNAAASFGTQGVNANVGLFPGDLIQTGLSIVLGIFAFSLLIQIVTKVLNSNLFDDLFKGRSMSSDDIVHYTNMAMEAYNKYEEMNTPK